MKTFLVAILVLVIVISAAVFGFKYWQSKSATGNAPVSLEQTVEGVLTPVPFTGEYSDVVDVNGKLIGVTSTTVNLKQYENRKVKVSGQYSGNTMYADSVTILP